MSLEVLSAVHGIAPRSEELLKLGVDFEKGRASRESLDLKRDEETIEWCELQEDAGIDIRENGKLHWQDHLRPIVKASGGFAPDIDEAPITRWYEDNRFYRKPTIVDRLHFDEQKFNELQPNFGLATENVSLIAPSTFAALCEDQLSEFPAERNVFQLYGELLWDLAKKGVKRVTFEDYTNGHIDEHGRRSALSEVEQYKEWCPDITFALINPRNRATAIPWRLSPRLGVQIPPHDIPIIAAQPDYRQPEFKGGEVWYNVVDASTTAPDDLNENLLSLRILRNFGVAKLVLTHTVDLECLPRVVAQDKVKRLGEFAARAQEILA